MGFILAVLVIAWFPGAVTWRLLNCSLSQASPTVADARRLDPRFRRTSSPGETWFLAERPLWASLFLCTATGLVIVGWLGLTLAQVGRFTPTTISAALATYTAVCLGLLAWRYPSTCSRRTKVQREQVNGGRGSPGVEPSGGGGDTDGRPEPRRRPGGPDSSGVEPSGGGLDADGRPEPRRRPGGPDSSGVEPSGGAVGLFKRFWSRGPWEGVVAALLFGGALYLYASLPAEYLPAFFDPGWYLNTGALVAETGAMAFESRPFSALPPDLRPLFFSSFSSLRYGFPQLPESQSRGFFLTAFAVPEADDAIITPYHPPLLSIWLALFYTIGGVRAALHVPALFGALSVLAMLLAGRALFGRGPGLLAALLLALSLPQIYFSRTPYAEVLAQFLVLVGLYALTAFARGAGPAHAALAGLAFGQVLMTKIEGVLLLIPLAVFWATWLARRGDGWRALLIFGLPFAALSGQALVLAATVNRLYVALNGYGVWSRLGVALGQPLLWLGLGMTGVVAVLWLARHRRSWRGLPVGRWLTQTPSPAARRVVVWAVLLLATYGYFVQPVVGSIMSGGLKAPGTPGLVQLGQFLSPWGVWLGVVGLVLLLDRGFARRHVFFAALILTTCGIVLAAPTISTGVSPLYAVRRQVPVVIPAFLLLASYALLSLFSTLKRWRLAQGLAILVLVAGLVGIARPYLRYREMRGTVDFVERLASQFPSGALVLFEAVDVDSYVGRFAAPLWAMHGIDTLLLSPTAAPEDLSQALALWQSRNRAMYWVSASPRPPMLVSGYRFDLVSDELWESSAITPDPAYPPKVEYLEVPFYIYEIRPESP